MVETDASAKAIGVVLIQDGHLVAYESKKLNRAQQNYSTYERELFAIIYALCKWRHYLYGESCEIFTDHKSLKYLFTQKELNMRQTR